jgi:hypothetical protein
MCCWEESEYDDEAYSRCCNNRATHRNNLRLSNWVLTGVAVVFAVIFLPTIILGCDPDLRHACWVQHLMTAVVTSGWVVADECCVVRNKNGCTAYKSCYDGWIDQQFLNSSYPHCTLEVIDGADTPNGAQAVVNTYPANRVLTPVFYNPTTAVCSLKATTVAVWWTGVSFGIMLAIVLTTMCGIWAAIRVLYCLDVSAWDKEDNNIDKNNNNNNKDNRRESTVELTSFPRHNRDPHAGVGESC